MIALSAIQQEWAQNTEDKIKTKILLWELSTAFDSLSTLGQVLFHSHSLFLLTPSLMEGVDGISSQRLIPITNQTLCGQIWGMVKTSRNLVLRPFQNLVV